MPPATCVRSSIPAMVSEHPLLREEVGSIAVLTLNRPQARNTLSEEMLTALRGELTGIAASAHLRALVIAGNGPAFSAGHDLKQVTARRSDADGGRGYLGRLMENCSSVMLAMLRLPRPVIAAVEGPATAAGCQLVATCDLAVASTSASFCTPGVHIGLFCSTPMVALSRNVARKHAMQMLLTGDSITAEEAYRIGLINQVVPAGAAREQALALARRITKESAAVIKIGKQAFYEQIEMSIADAYRHASEVMVENMMMHDAIEGIAAFIEKRPPRWDDR